MMVFVLNVDLLVYNGGNKWIRLVVIVGESAANMCRIECVPLAKANLPSLYH